MEAVLSIKEQVLALFNNEADVSFDDVCHQIFKLQSTHNKVYNQYLQILGTDINSISSPDEIPLLPITSFKHHNITTGEWIPSAYFLSSGTTQITRSKHLVKDINWYNTVSEKIFTYFFPELNVKKIIGLLPGYLDNNLSSLIHMVRHLIESYGFKDGAIINDEFDRLKTALKESDPSFLFAVTFALLDFVDSERLTSISPYICFTGGMKGRGQELGFEEIVNRVKRSIPEARLCAEYGMTELFSQAYAREDGLYQEPPTMRILPKEISDPLSNAINQKSAQLGIIDLANVDTISFILSEDLVHKRKEGFEVLGRLDYSDTRGCNLMYMEIGQ